MKYVILTYLGDVVETEHVSYCHHRGATTHEVMRVGSAFFKRSTPVEERPVGLVYPTPCIILKGDNK